MVAEYALIANDVLEPPLGQPLKIISPEVVTLPIVKNVDVCSLLPLQVTLPSVLTVKVSPPIV